MFKKSTTITFPYAKKKYQDLSIPEPIISLPTKTSVGYLDIKFLIDSGADITLLPINPYADLLGVEADGKETIKIGGISRSVKAFSHPVTFKIFDKEVTIRCYFAPIRTIPLLGRLDLWDHYNIYFNNQKQRTELVSI